MSAQERLQATARDGGSVDVAGALIDHLDLWTGAVTKKSSSGRGSSGKIELTGIKKLRELILELAVRGKLVEQDGSDESVEQLLEKIELEKRSQLKAKKIRKPKSLPDIQEVDYPFAIPKSWRYCRLNDIGIWGSGATPKRGNTNYYGGGIPWFKSGELSKDFIDLSEETITDLAVQETSVRMNQPGDVLIAMYGATIGKASILEVAGTTNQAVCACTPWQGVSNRFLLLLLKAYRSRFIAMGAGGAQPNISRDKIIATVIGLPPEQEQHRIVQKVDELMALCDRLEQQTSEQLDAHETLVDTLLGTLTQSENAAELADNWTRLAAHFDTLFTTEQGVDKLKQTILQLAVMGRLVEQDAGDAPASALVSKMLHTRDMLARTERMKTKANDSVPSSDQYLDIPSSWAWIRLGNMAKFIDYRGKTPTKISSGKRLITAKNIRQGYIDLEPEEFISEADYTSWMTRGFPRRGDLLFTPEAPLGNAAIVDLNEEFALAQRAICFQWHIPEVSKFMLLQILAYPFQQQLVENATGMTATGIKAAKLKEIPVAVPPLEEQHRIVQKVDELMNLCDQLKVRLNQASETRCQLAEAVVEGALS